MPLACVIRPTEYPLLSHGERLLIARESRAPEAPKPRLLDRVREAIRARHYSRRTEKTYVAWIRRYIFFHGKRHPAEMGAREITDFLSALAVKDKVAASDAEPGAERAPLPVPGRAGAGCAVARRSGQGEAARAASRRADL